jgi:hypothetical protein
MEKCGQIGIQKHGGMFICPSGLYATARAARIAKAEQLAPRYRTELLLP